MSQSQLAKAAGTDKSEITRLESNRDPLTLSMAIRISKVLEIDPIQISDEYLKFIQYPYSKRIKEVRKQLGISQMELGKRMGVYTRAINTWENEREAPRRYTFPKIVKFFEENGFSLLNNKYS